MNILYKLYFYIYFSTALFAVSAPPFLLEIEQSDGLRIPVRMYGDEYNNWMETEDGYVITLIDDGISKDWYYCVLNDENKFISSGIRATYPTPNNLDIPKNLRAFMKKKRNYLYKYGNVREFQNTNLQRNGSEKTLKPLVFLVEFPDKQSTYSKLDFEKLLFAENLSPEGSSLPSDYNMSARDYFYEISNGLQNIEGSVVDWKTAENGYNYYVDGNQGQGEGTHGKIKSAGSLVVETALSINEEGFDFSQFDNGNGAIDVIILIVAGQGVPYTDENYFWPHMFFIPTGEDLSNIDSSAPQDNGNLILDGVVIQKYIVIHEKYAFNYGGASSGDIHPIGTFCHEIGHVLGVPDLYDNSTVSAAGIGDWGLMGSGNWMSQTSPAYMSAWSRYKLGYINPGVIENVQDYSLTIAAAEGANQNAAYILPLDSNMPQEYLIIENRQQILSDKNLPGSGLLVWHIDETITDVYPLHASVNQDQNSYGVNLLQADGQATLYTDCSFCSDAGDPFTGIGNSMLTGSTNPNTDTYIYDRDADGENDFGGDSGVEIRDIIESNAAITLTVTNPNIQGSIVSYDENDIGMWSFTSSNSNLKWTGIRFQADNSTTLSGVLIPYVESTSDYEIKVWEGWSGSKPTTIKKHYIGTWNPLAEFRQFGWAFISLLDDSILLTSGEEYYIEVYYPEIGNMRFFDYSLYGSSIVSNASYYRANANSDCNFFNIGDWNIRAVLSGENCGIVEGETIWPGDTDGVAGVTEEDILAIGLYYGIQGCYRPAGGYTWEAQPYPDNWDPPEAAKADTNGDGKVDVHDVLAVLVNFGNGISTPADFAIDNIQFSVEELARHRDNFYTIYQNLSGDSESSIRVRDMLERLFDFDLIYSEFILGNNYPNPFNPKTTIPFYVTESSNVEILIYDLRGRLIETIINTNIQDGWNQIFFNGNDYSSGIYLYQLKNNGNVIAQNKMLLMK